MRTTIIALLLSIAILNCYAGTGVRPEKAKTVAETYYHYTTGQSNVVGKIAYMDKDNNGNILYYIVDINKSGFVIVSGTSITHPIIAISTHGNYKAISNSGVEDYLNYLHNHISKLYQLNMTPQQSITSEWSQLSSGKPLTTSRSTTSVSPLLTTTWNQSPYYNEYCPGGSVTGCVATAMAQIVKYWNYPTEGTGSYSYTDGSYGTLSASFDSVFNWSIMPASVSSSTPTNETNAVASLMYKLGVSVAMEYSPSGSGASVLQSENPGGPCAQYSYVNYFGYNSKTMQGLIQANYTTSAWDSLINIELNNSRPIEYVGFGVDGGHTWVVDGYNTTGLYDMNWGWGGLDDGYFALNDLDPSGIPLGSDNAMLIGIEPSTALPTCSEPTSVAASSITTSSAVVSWTGTGSAKSYNLNYQASGVSSWTSVTGITSATYSLSGLTAGTTYNVQVQQVCTGESSSFTNTTTFSTTQPSCGEPTSVAANSITTTGATISWVGSGSAKSYNLNYQVSGASSWTSVTGITSASYSLSGLTAGTTYNVQVQQVCTGESSSFTNTTTFSTTQPSCGEPTSVAANSIATTSATISWVGSGSAKSYNLNYQVSGASSWISLTGITSENYTLNGLTAGTTYNIQVQQECTGGESSGFTNTLTFSTTQPTCSEPTSLAANSITASGATISWVGSGSPESYNLNYEESGASSWTSITGITSESYSLSGLTAGTTYDIRVQQVCSGSETSSFTNTLSFETGNITYCTSSGITADEYIKTVKFGSIDNTSSNDGGYYNYTNLSTDIKAGTRYLMTLTPGFTSTTYTEAWQVYVDYNHTGDFELIGEKKGSGSVSGSISVPSTAVNGSTRMRIVMHRASYIGGACSSFTDGDVQDYTVVISGSSSSDITLQPNDVDSMNVGQNTSEISVNVYPNPTSSILNIKYLNPIDVTDITLVDATGKILLKSSSKLDVLDFSKYAQGWYILVITGSDGSVSKNIVTVVR